jgi:transcription initiation factor TFIIIB Brf1 subunit/transcription initiation factor TFIIB
MSKLLLVMTCPRCGTYVWKEKPAEDGICSGCGWVWETYMLDIKAKNLHYDNVAKVIEEHMKGSNG